MYIVPPTRPHRSLIGQPIIGVGSISFSSTYIPSSSSSPTSGSSNSNISSSRGRRSRSSNTYYTSTGWSSIPLTSASPSRHAPCPPAYQNRCLRRRDAFGMGEAAALTSRIHPLSTSSHRRRGLEMPIERIPAAVRDERRSRFDNYYHMDDDETYSGELGPGNYRESSRYSRRRGENRLQSFSEHVRNSGRQELIDLMRYAYEDAGISSWTQYCGSC